jgi:hypothetical protein
LTIVLLFLIHGIVDILERPVIKSHFELDVLEVILFVGVSLIVDHWFIVLEATTCVDPTVGVS